MTSVDTRSISQKLIRLEEVITELSAIRETSRETFLHDRRLQAATERYFILGIEIITDIGNHLLVETTHQATTSYEDIIVQLGTHKIVPPEVATRNPVWRNSAIGLCTCMTRPIRRLCLNS